jgi:hypothetical protein
VGSFRECGPNRNPIKKDEICEISVSPDAEFHLGVHFNLQFKGKYRLICKLDGDASPFQIVGEHESLNSSPYELREFDEVMRHDSRMIR